MGSVISFVDGAKATASSAASVSNSGDQLVGVRTGDFILACIHGDAASKTNVTNDSTTWTTYYENAASGSTASILYRYAVNGEATSYSFKHGDSSSDNFSLTLAVFRGVEPTQTKPITDWAVTTLVTNTTVNTVATLTRWKYQLVVQVDFIGSNTTLSTPPVGYTLAQTNDGFNPGCSIYYLEFAAAGTVGSVSFVLAASTVQKAITMPLFPGPDAGVQVAGPFTPNAGVATDNGGSAITTTNPGNITAEDATRVTWTLSGTTASDFLDATFAATSRVPSNCTVVGYIMSGKQSYSGGTTGVACDNLVKPIIGGSAVGTSEARSDGYTTTLLWDDYGDRDDLWGATAPTAAQANASDFGFRVAVQGIAAGANRVAGWDTLRCWFYYSTVQGAGKLESLLMEKRSLIP